MTHNEATAFAGDWVKSWNAVDVEGVLRHFTDGVRFTSPKAAQRVGTATVHGKDALRAYWNASVALITSIQFTLDRVVFDPECRELVIVYDAEINGQRNRACEFLRLDEDGRAREAEAMYGALL